MIYKLATRVIQYFLGTPLNLAPPKFNVLLRSPQLFWSEIFRSPAKFRRGAATMLRSSKLVHVKELLTFNLQHNFFW